MGPIRGTDVRHAVGVAVIPGSQYSDDRNLRARQRLWEHQIPRFDLVGWVLGMSGATPGLRVLVVGCGIGMYLREMVSRGVEAVVRPELIVACLCRSERRPEGGRSVRQRAEPCRAKERLVSRIQTTDDWSHSVSLPTRRPRPRQSPRSRRAERAGLNRSRVGTIGRVICARRMGTSVSARGSAAPSAVDPIPTVGERGPVP
jgi:hypothetical protein